MSFGNAIVGAVAAGISWGLYGPLGGYWIVGTEAALRQNNPESIALSLSSLVGAALIGIGGARWLTSEVDKTLLRAAASRAAGSQASQDASQRMALATPVQALDIAKSLREIDPGHAEPSAARAPAHDTGSGNP